MTCSKMMLNLVKRWWFLVVNVITFAGMSMLLLEQPRRSMARGLNILRILYRDCLLSGWEIISFGYLSRYRILLKRGGKGMSIKGFAYNPHVRISFPLRHETAGYDVCDI